MKYNPKKPFEGQTQEVKDYIITEVIDQTKEPVSRDSLKRPHRFEFPFADETGTEYVVSVTNEYIDNHSWRLHNQVVEVTKK